VFLLKMDFKYDNVAFFNKINLVAMTETCKGSRYFPHKVTFLGIISKEVYVIGMTDFNIYIFSS